jgi:hypothetical protein
MAMMRGRLSLGTAALVLATLGQPIAALAAGVVTTCDETNLANALSGGGLVTFACGPGPATIAVSAAQTINVSTTIDGGGRITIRGNASTDVFRVTGTASFTVRNLIIAAATSQAGIFSDGSGTVSATNCTFADNYYGISDRGSAAIDATNCTFSGGNSGIDHRGTGPVTATDCTFAAGSYGIDNRNTGPITARACTFVGGDYGIDNESTGMVNAANCTFSGSEYGIDNEQTGTVTATNCTFSDSIVNAIDNESTGTATLTNCILADSGTSNCSGTITDGGNNLDTGLSCGFWIPSLSNVSAGLDPAGLADNGGPTRTIAVLPGSPAIDGGNQAVCAAPPIDNRDQRGFARPGAGFANCTIGAFEFTGLVGAPAASPAGLLSLAVLLGAGGWLLLRRRGQAASPLR